MNRRLTRWVCFTMLGMLAFWQASFVLACCGMARGQLAQMRVAQTHEECCDHTVPTGDRMPMTPNACFAHSTADLQAAGMPASLPAAPTAVILLLPASDLTRPIASWPDVSPPTIPRRILLHSFLI